MQNNYISDITRKMKMISTQRKSVWVVLLLTVLSILPEKQALALPRPAMPSKSSIAVAIKRNPKKIGSALLAMSALALGYDIHFLTQEDPDDGTLSILTKAADTKIWGDYLVQKTKTQEFIKAVKDGMNKAGNIALSLHTPLNIRTPIHPCHKDNTMIQALQTAGFTPVAQGTSADEAIGQINFEKLISIIVKYVVLKDNIMKIDHDYNNPEDDTPTVIDMESCALENRDMAYTLGVTRLNPKSDYNTRHGLNILNAIYKNYYNIYAQYKEYTKTHKYKEKLKKLKPIIYFKKLPMLPARMFIYLVGSIDHNPRVSKLLENLGRVAFS